MSVSKRVKLGIIYTGRKLFANTPVQRLRITTSIYEKLFHGMYKQPNVVTEFKGIKLKLPTKDVTVTPAILGGYFESLEVDVFKELIGDCNTLLDIGGNLGLYAVIAAVDNKRAKIISFEPVTENIKYFRENIALNKIPASRVKIEQKGVGEKRGKLTLFLSEGSVGTHSAARRHDAKDKIEVPMVSVDDYVKSSKVKPDIIKIDVEGYDGYVIEGSKATLKEYEPTIFVEYGPVLLKACNYKPKRLLDILFSTYKVAYIFDEKRHKLRKTSKKELAEVEGARIENVLFASREEHIEIIESAFIIPSDR